MITTAPQLFRAALGLPLDDGPHRCLFCGAACGSWHPAADHLRASFTGLGDVAAPASAHVCGGCVLCLRESCAVDLIDGTRGRPVAKGAMRAFSWVLTARAALAASKAHLPLLRAACLDSPEPPFALVLSDSGKKHLLYRGVVCHDRQFVTLTLEGERLDYRPAELSARLDLAARLAAAAGKSALAGPPGLRLAAAVCERFADGEELFEQWETVYADPLSRLAVWLAPGRDEAAALHPPHCPRWTQRPSAGSWRG
ncbi:MAG TPA: hypothetical protein VFA26_05315 [Gemmataceae bacterium]|nr:hypothetical protein [Gemmataceae bacterium]